MLRNYLKTAIRTLLRNKSYSIINITGLTVGIAACLLIYLITSYHNSFDTYHTKKDRIFRTITAAKTASGMDYNSGVPFAVPEGLRTDFPQLEKVADIVSRVNDQFTVPEENGQPGHKYKVERGFFFADPAIFDIFDVKWLAGDSKTALAEPNTVVLSQDMANQYFGDWTRAMGRTILYWHQRPMKVTGILENPRTNTDIPMRMVAPIQDYQSWKNMQHNWVTVHSAHNVFVLLKENYTAAKFNARLPAFVKRHKPAENAEEGMEAQPLSAIHFDTRISTVCGTTFNKQTITVLSLIGIFLLVVACVNFINLATAQAVNRAKEVGVRKVLGSNRGNLIVQFMGETLVITLLAVLLAISIAATLIAPLNSLLETSIQFNPLTNPAIILYAAIVTIAVTVLAGFYPALVLSGFNPITAIRSKITTKMVGGISLRRALVVLQFSIAQVLIIGMLVVLGQMSYFKNAPLGYNKDNILIVPIPQDSLGRAKSEYIKNELLQQPGVQNISYSFTSPSDNSIWSSDFKYDNRPNAEKFETSLKWADASLFSTFDMQFLAGQPYKTSDTLTEFVVNETFVRQLGLHNPQDVLGKTIDLWSGEMKARICGVVKDFHSRSLRAPLEAVIFGSIKGYYATFSLKIQAVKAKDILAYTEKLWTSSFPSNLYQYEFLDEKIDRFYKQESTLSTLYTIFAGIAIFISCLGLYGLVSFLAVQKTKEVGIRKVLGASIGSIVYLFSKEFTILILISFCIAAPLGWYLMNSWLEDFSYRIPLSMGFFVLAILGSVFIAWLTAGYRSVRAALANPVKSLRNQ